MAKPIRTEMVDKVNQFLKSAENSEVGEVKDEKTPKVAQEVPVPADAEEAAEAVEDAEGGPELPEGDLPELDSLPEGEDAEEEAEEEETGDLAKEFREFKDEIKEMLETMVEGMESQKKLLEELSGEESKEQDGPKFEDFQEDDKDDEDKEEEEFGLEDEDLTTAKTERGATLREQRKSRLAGKVQKKAEEKKDKSLKDQWKPEVKNLPKVYDTSPTKTTLPKKDDCPAFFKAADLTLVHDATAKAWKVMDKDANCLYTIPQGDRPDAEFACKPFAEAFILEADKLGVEETLKKYNAVKVEKVAETAPVVEAAPVAPVAEVAAPEAVAPVTDDEKTVIASNYQRRFARAFNLALTAMNKNLLYSPLKSALFDIMANLDIAEPEKIIESAFAHASKEHFDVAVKKAEDYLRMSDEAFIETESAIGDIEVAQMSSPSAPEAEDHETGEELKARASRNSLPFVTADESSDDSFEKLCEAMPRPKLATFLKKKGN